MATAVLLEDKFSKDLAEFLAQLNKKSNGWKRAPHHLDIIVPTDGSRLFYNTDKKEKFFQYAIFYNVKLQSVKVVVHCGLHTRGIPG